MKIHQPKNIKAPIILTVLVVSTLILATGIAYKFKTWPFTQSSTSFINLNDATEEEKNTGLQVKEQTIDTTSGDTKAQIGSDPAPAPKPIEGSDLKSVHMEITSVSQDQSILRIRSLIQTVTSTGTCTLTLRHASQPSYTATSETQALSSSTTCKGFDIALNQLVPGEWKATINFTNNELTASTEKDIKIQ